MVLTSIWPPYVDPKLPGHGLAVSIVTEAFRRDGTYRKLLRQASEEVWKQSYLRKKRQSTHDETDTRHH